MSAPREIAIRNVSWRAVGAAALVIATLLAYMPAFNAGFVYDDEPHILTSPTLTRSLDSLAAIWFKPAWSPQYYPATHTFWWIQYQLWGFNPIGYHVVNVLLHIGAVMLLWLLLGRLGCDARVAWLTAALFALHPVHVESAGYVSELKNVLSTVFYLAAAICYWTFHTVRLSDGSLSRALPPRAAWRWYLWASLLFVCALLSKTVTASLPAAILLAIWWKHGRVRARDIWPVIPLFVLGASFGMLTIWLERHQVGVGFFPEEFDLSWGQRMLLAGRAAWFYAGKLLWPINLTINYARWAIDTAVWWQWLFPAGGAVLIGGLWTARRRLGRGPLAAVLFFGGTLVPALGFVDVYPFRFSYVADHYQYLASIGLLLLFASAWLWLWSHGGFHRRISPLACAFPVLCVLGLLTWRHAYVFGNVERLFQDALRKNPQSWLAHLELAARVMERDPDRAEFHIQSAIAIRPDLTMAHNAYAELMVMRGRDDTAMAYRQRLLTEGIADEHTHVGLALQYMRDGQKGPALEHAKRALTIARDPRQVRWFVGKLLFDAGQIDEATAYIVEAIKATPMSGANHMVLGQIYVSLGRIDDAIASFRRAAQLRPHTASIQAPLSELLLKRGDVRGALRHLAYAVEAEPNDPALRLAMGNQLLAMGKTRAGLRHLHKAAELLPENPEAWYQLAYAQARAGLTTEAIHSGNHALNMTVNGVGDMNIRRGIESLLHDLGARRDRE